MQFYKDYNSLEPYKFRPLGTTTVNNLNIPLQSGNINQNVNSSISNKFTGIQLGGTGNSTFNSTANTFQSNKFMNPYTFQPTNLK